MIKQIYNLFERAGLGKQASELSTIAVGENRKQVQPLIGDYVAMVDDILDSRKIMPKRADSLRKTAVFSSCVEKIFDYVKNDAKNARLYSQIDRIFPHFDESGVPLVLLAVRGSGAGTGTQGDSPLGGITREGGSVDGGSIGMPGGSVR